MLQVLSYSIYLALFLLLHRCPAVVLAKEQYTRADFPAEFVFGSGASAYQYEGAAAEDGRTPSIWDNFAHSGRTKGSNGDVACDGYHRYKEDVGLMVETGLEAFRFSISWSRLIPNGRGPINTKGLVYYNNLIDELISNGIQVHATLCHYDLPQVLEDEYGGWLSRKIVKDFAEFADVCFMEFGDRVSHWTTLNEVNVFAVGGYDGGFTPPARCSARTFCVNGDSSTERYTVVHNMLLAHSAATMLYREKYKATQKGYVGLNIFTEGLIPHTNSTEDAMAAKRAQEFFIGWIIDPLVFGDYPDVVKKRAQKRIPTFTKQEAAQLKGSFDFIGLNYYITIFVKDNPSPDNDMTFTGDMAAEFIYDTGPVHHQYPLRPWGLERVLEYVKGLYGNPPIYIHENGQMTPRDGILGDTTRVEYMKVHIGSVLAALRNGSNIRGYFEWSFFDCFELLDGWGSSYGLHYVDLDDKELKRYPKLSAHWYSKFLKGKSSLLDQ